MFHLDEGDIGFLHRDLYYDEQFQALNLGYAKIIFYRMSKTSGPFRQTCTIMLKHDRS
jgi:hypothetical protein